MRALRVTIAVLVAASMAATLPAGAAGWIGEARFLDELALDRDPVRSRPTTHESSLQALRDELAEVPGDRLDQGPFAEGCSRIVGLVGTPLYDLVDFLSANGIMVLAVDGSDIAGGLLDSLDVIYVLRTGVGVMRSEGAAIDDWVRRGGVLLTEFSATQELYGSGPLGYLSGDLVDGFHVPSGSVCGGNDIRLVAPENGLAAGLPERWSCSGDPIGVLNVFVGVDPQLCVVAVVEGSDRDADGADDPVVAVAAIGDGLIVPFFTDCGDWQPLEDPRDCALGTTCMRSGLDESLLLNALCRATPCGPACGDCDALRATVQAVAPLAPASPLAPLSPRSAASVRSALSKRVEKACRALERSKTEQAGRLLCDLLLLVDAQDGGALTGADADALRDCVHDLAVEAGVALPAPCGPEMPAHPLATMGRRPTLAPR